MPLTNIQIRPGFNKQVTETGAEGQWIDGDFVRFRYGLPEKIGGWTEILNSTIVGAVREQLIWADLDGRKYVALGTNKVLVIYFEGAFYDITPLDDPITGATFTTVNNDATVTVNKIGHGLTEGDLFTFTSVTPPTGAGYTDADFTTNTFQVVTATVDTFTITMASTAGTTVAASGSAVINPYVEVGPLNQTAGYGWGTSSWGGQSGLVTTLNGSLADDTNGNNGSATNITVTSTVGFPTNGSVQVGTEFISYTNISGNDLTGITRGAGGTRAAHSNGASVEYFTAWGQASTSTTVLLDPASWSLDHFGSTLVATIKNGNTFQWEAISSFPAALSTRAAAITGAPTTSVMSIVSERDRHLIILGTETTIGTADTSAYIMQFVGPPFTFSIRQVGSNCRLIRQHAVKYVNGKVFWMGQAGGFFVYDGTVKSLPCLVEDFVFTSKGDNLGINYTAGEQVYAGLNHLYEEITWFYAKNGQEQVDRVVTYNYTENTWTTGSLARTSWADATLYDNPYATEFEPTSVPTFPVVQGATNVNGASVYYAHEVGNNEVDALGNKTAIPAFITSGDFDLSAGGDGQFFMSIRRFIPDFKILTGDAQVTLNLRSYPAANSVSSPLGPFTINSSTDKVDTRARSRFASVKVANTSTDQNWRYGTFRADVQPDGMRG